MKIIVNKTILKSKVEEGDSAVYEYLIDNTETDEQTDALIALQKLSETVPKDDIRYVSIKNKVLFSMGINLTEL